MYIYSRVRLNVFTITVVSPDGWPERVR